MVRTSTTTSTCEATSNPMKSPIGRVECPMVKNGYAIPFSNCRPSQTHHPGGDRDDSDHQDHQGQWAIVRPKAATQPPHAPPPQPAPPTRAPPPARARPHHAPTTEVLAPQV